MCVYANLQYAETKGWETEEQCVGSAVRRTRGTVVPSFIPSSLLLPLPCSSAQEEDATARQPEKSSKGDQGWAVHSFSEHEGVNQEYPGKR